MGPASDWSGQGRLAGDLLDFLSADVQVVPACPTFRENLRERVWERLTQERLRRARARRRLDPSSH